MSGTAHAYEKSRTGTGSYFHYYSTNRTANIRTYPKQVLASSWTTPIFFRYYVESSRYHCPELEISSDVVNHGDIVRAPRSLGSLLESFPGNNERLSRPEGLQVGIKRRLELSNQSKLGVLASPFSGGKRTFVIDETSPYF